MQIRGRAWSEIEKIGREREREMIIGRDFEYMCIFVSNRGERVVD